MRRISRRGFTIIELMIVMAIILVLISLLVVGVRVMSTSGKKDQTRTLLQALNGVTGELKIKSPPTSPIFYSPNAALPQSGPMLAPGDVTVDGGQARYSATAVLATASVMIQAQAIPDVQTAINGLPAAQFTTFIYPPPPISAMTPTAGRIWVWVPNAPYRAGMDIVEDVDPTVMPLVDKLYQCKNIPVPSSNPLRPGSDPNWTPLPPVSVPPFQTTNIQFSTRIPLDAWGNPMIFVPASGLAGVLLADGQYHTIVSPDGQPFWASAGPDGNFTNGDDNIYSFQK